jgi:CHC2 zinc finger
MSRAIQPYHNPDPGTPPNRAERRGLGTRSIIEEAKAMVPAIDLADFLAGPGKMRRVGKEWVTNCVLPDHEDRVPSFTVNPEKNLFYCHGCMSGGDVVELARLAWGYEKSEVAMAAADLLHEFGHPIPERPQSWYAKQQRQKPIRDAIDRARFEHLRRRLFRVFFKPPLLAIEDEEEREAEYGILWEATEPLAEMLLGDLSERRSP